MMTKNIFLHTILLDILLFFSILSLSERPYILLAVTAIIAVILLALKKGDWRIFFFGFCFGVVIEFAAVHYSAWAYPTPNLFGVPYWILLTWGVVAVSAHRTELYVTSKKA